MLKRILCSKGKGRTSNCQDDGVGGPADNVDRDDVRRVLGKTLETNQSRWDRESDVGEQNLTCESDL